MKDIRKLPIQQEPGLGKQRNYNEVVEFLDNNWKTAIDTKAQKIKKLDAALGSPAKDIKGIAVAGTNGKSITIQFVSKLLKEEGMKIGAFYAPHILTYNERLSVSGESIANKEFTEIANEVINASETNKLQAHSFEILTMMAVLYFKKHGVDAAVFETSDVNFVEQLSIVNPCIIAITRVIDETAQDEKYVPSNIIERILSLVGKGSHVFSADQSKANLQLMLEITEQKGGVWGMPIRKLAQLTYPFEQLHGRCGALAERIAEVYVNTFANQDSIVVSDTILAKTKGQRGRPTLEAKRLSELNPKRTVNQFWRETCATLPARFQLFDKEKPSILLDNASNLDAIENILLGIRLLHYKKPLKGLTLVIGCNNPDINVNGLARALRYFFKKTSGQVVICPVNSMSNEANARSWDVEKTINCMKDLKIKARSAGSFQEAFEYAQKSVDERNGLVVVTGSTAIINEYWQNKGIKKIA